MLYLMMKSLPFSLDCSFLIASSMFSIMPRIIACFYLSTSGFYIYVIKISSLNITSIIFIILKYLYFFKKIENGNIRRRQKNNNKNNKKHAICVGQRYAQAHKNNLNKTWALPQTIGGKDESNIKQNRKKVVKMCMLNTNTHMCTFLAW
jgi:hypothetical protein